MSEQSGNFFRNLLAVVIGIVTGVVLVMVVQGFGHQVYPPGSVDPKDKEAMRALVASLPVGALLFPIAAYAVGSFGGGAAAAAVGTGRRMTLALVVGVVLLLAGVANLVMIPHPLWFSVLTVLVFIPAAWLGGRMVSSRSAPDQPAA